MVSDRWSREYVLGIAHVVVELLPQVSDVGPEDLGIVHIGRPPNILKEMVLGQYSTGV